MEEELARAGSLLRGTPFEVAAKVERLTQALREREKEMEELRRKLALGGSAGGRDLLSSAQEVNGVKLVAARSEVGDPKALREVADQLRERLGSGVVVLAGVADGKVSIVATVTKDLAGRIHAGKIVGRRLRRHRWQGRRGAPTWRRAAVRTPASSTRRWPQVPSLLSST